MLSKSNFTACFAFILAPFGVRWPHLAPLMPNLASFNFNIPSTRSVQKGIKEAGQNCLLASVYPAVQNKNIYLPIGMDINCACGDKL